MQPPFEQLGPIIRHMGDQEFMHHLHRFITRQVRVDHVALEYLDHNKQLIPLDRASISSLPIKQLGKAYRENEIFRVDPIRHIEEDGRQLAGDLRLMLNHVEEVDPSPQAELFARYGIVQRIVIAGRAGKGWISLKMIRCDHFGPASSGELARAEQLTRLLIDLCKPHSRLLLAAQDRSAWFYDVLHSERVIALIFPGLSSRECQCINLVLRGHSNDSAAGELGISINTFITLRARAYKKTGACSRDDLVKMVKQHFEF